MSRENENNRKLSPSEKARGIKFETQKSIMIDKGFEVKDLTIGLVYANIMAFVLAIPIIVCFAIVYILLTKVSITEKNDESSDEPNISISTAVRLSVSVLSSAVPKTAETAEFIRASFCTAAEPDAIKTGKKNTALANPRPGNF